MKGRNHMKTWQKLMSVTSICLLAAAVIFLTLSVLGYEKAWTLPVALGCSASALLLRLVLHK